MELDDLEVANQYLRWCWPEVVNRKRLGSKRKFMFSEILF